MLAGEMLDWRKADELRGQLHCAVIGQRIIVVERTSSTNDAILQLTAPQGAWVSGPPSGTDEGLVLFAEHQTAGRGQRGNRWESAAGKGLWFSVLLRPVIEISRSPLLTAWAAQTISETIENEFSLKTTIKLPNDVQIEGRKVAGVLVEMRAHEKARHSAIVGIGINVNQGLEDFPKELQSRAISLALALGRQVDR